MCYYLYQTTYKSVLILRWSATVNLGRNAEKAGHGKGPVI